MMNNRLGLTTLLGVFIMHLFFELIGKTTQTLAFHYFHVHSTR